VRWAFRPSEPDGTGGILNAPRPPYLTRSEPDVEYDGPARGDRHRQRAEVGSRTPHPRRSVAREGQMALAVTTDEA
jgi:hypothetical protein